MDDVRVSIVASSRYIQVLREDGSQLSRHVTIEDAIESAVNAGPGRYRIVYPERSIEVSKAYGTLPGSGAPPAAPVEVFLSDSTAAYVGLAWDDPGDVLVWTVYRDGVSLGTTAFSGYFDATVVPEAQYVYQVQATNTAGSSALSDGLSVTVPANSPPYWTEDPQTLYVGRGFTLDLTTLATDDDGHDLTFSVVTGAVPGLALAGDNYSGAPTAVGVYDVTFSASDGYASTAGTIAFTVLDPDVTAPDPPTGLAAAVAGSTVTLTWNAASDPSGLSSYRVRRNGAYLATVSPPVETYVDAGVPDGTYTYTVRAADASANVNVSADSDPVVAVVSAAPLDAPTSFTATSSTSTQADLSWVPGPNGPVPTGYELQRSVNQTTWTAVEEYVSPATSVTDGGLTSGTRYYYRVRATKGADVSAWATTSVTVVAAPVGAATFVIPASTATRTFDGTVAANWTSLPTNPGRAPQPGDIIELAAGTHGRLTFQRIIGSASNPITIRSSASGKAIFSVAATTWITTISGCQYVTFDGTGTAGTSYGLKWLFTGATIPPGALFIQNYNTTMPKGLVFRGFEIDGGYTVGGSSTAYNLGIHIRSPAGTKTTTTSSGYYGAWFDGVTFEDFYVHGIYGEGLYIGPNAYELSLPLRNIVIDNGLITDCGREAIQGKSWFAGANRISNIVARRCGARNASSQNSTISLLWGQADFYNIRAEGYAAGSSAHGVQWWNAEDRSNPYPVTQAGEAAYGHTLPAYWSGRLYNILSFNHQDGIALSGYASGMLIEPKIYNCTSTQNRGRGIVTSSTTGAPFIRNNIALANATNISGSGATNNDTGSSVAGYFVDATNAILSSRDYHLVAERAATGGVVGTDLSSTDIEGTPRAGTASRGAYEYA